MDDLTKEHIIDVYSRSLMHHGPSKSEAVFWSAKGQSARFNAISSLIPQTGGLSLLDYGCGLGDLHAHLRAEGFNLAYTGMDINPTLIEAARTKYPGVEFMVCDIEREELARLFDISVLCGVFNYKAEGVNESFINTLRLLMGKTRLRMIATALSSKAERKQYDLNYHDPDELLSTLQNEVSSNASIDIDAIPESILIVIES